MRRNSILTPQFFAGETAEECSARVWSPLRRESIGILAGFNVESEDHARQTEAEVAAIAAETINSITQAGRFGLQYSTPEDVANGDTRCWARIKLTALLTDADALRRVSAEIISGRKTAGIAFPGVVEDGDWDRISSSGVSVSVRNPYRVVTDLTGSRSDLWAL